MADDELRMSFWSHLEELRKRLIRAFIGIGVGFVLCFNYSEEILAVLLVPLNYTMTVTAAFPWLQYVPNKTAQDLYFTSLTEPIMSHMKIGFIAGIMVTAPFILYQVWKFISPGLHERERRYAGQFVFFSTGFFAAGILFCYFFLLPFAIPFLVNYKTEHLKAIIKLSDYIDFTLKFMLASGIVFELPLLMILLGRMGILNPDMLTKFRKFALLISFVIGAIATPTPDVFNMTLMSVPIYLLYEIGILGVRFFGRRPKAADGGAGAS